MKKLVLLLIIPFALLLSVQTATAQEKTTPAEKNWNAYRAETMSGTISMVEPGTKSVFVKGSGDVSYKFLVTEKTKIEIEGSKASIEELGNQSNKQVTITFVARRNGNIAQSISVSG